MALKSLILAVCLTGAALAREPGEPFRPGMNFFSKQQDVQLGQEASRQVRQKYREVQSPFLKDYVRQIGNRLASAPAARETGFPFSFSVLQDKSVNAFALPGGPMFIFSGLVDNEAQLAAVMAHEMAHVILRHGTHQASKANLVKLPLLLAGEALGQESLLTTITNLGANTLILKYSRDAESDADAGAPIWWLTPGTIPRRWRSSSTSCNRWAAAAPDGRSSCLTIPTRVTANAPLWLRRRLSAPAAMASRPASSAARSLRSVLYPVNAAGSASIGKSVNAAAMPGSCRSTQKSVICSVAPSPK
jgi:hypothetical protein